MVNVMAGFNILHLEDELSIRTIMHDIFDFAVPQANVVQFSNSDDALAYVTDGRPQVSLFLLDIRVPGQVDGIGYAIKLRQLGYASMIAFASAYSKPASEVLTEVGEYVWLAKPLEVSTILEVTTQAQSLV